MAFKATISLQLGVRSHHRFSFTMFRVFFLCLTFRDVSSQLWRLVSLSSSVWRLKLHLQLSVRVTIPSQFDVQSHNLFSIWAFRATISFQFCIQTRHIFSVTTFRVVLLSWTFRDVSSRLWRSKPPSPYSFAFRAIIISQLRRSRSSFSVWRLEMSVLNYGVQCLHFLQFGVQSHYPFKVWHLEPLSLLNFSIQSHHLFSVRHSELPYLLSYDIQSRPTQFDIQRCQFSIMAFRATISLQLGVQRHHCFSITTFFSQFDVQRCQFSVMAFRAFIFFNLVFRAASPAWCSESLSLHSLMFKATISFQFGL